MRTLKTELMKIQWYDSSARLDDEGYLELKSPVDGLFTKIDWDLSKPGSADVLARKLITERAGYLTYPLTWTRAEFDENVVAEPNGFSRFKSFKVDLPYNGTTRRGGVYSQAVSGELMFIGLTKHLEAKLCDQSGNVGIYSLDLSVIEARARIRDETIQLPMKGPSHNLSNQALIELFKLAKFGKYYMKQMAPEAVTELLERKLIYADPVRTSTCLLTTKGLSLTSMIRSL